MATELIRWNDTPSGSHGALGPFSFVVSRVYSGGEWMLVAHLPGMERRRARGGLGEVKAIAESWLREFTASLGALFACDLREHLERQAGIEQELGDDYSETPGETALEQAHFHWGCAEAHRDAIKHIDHGLGESNGS
jgi:hypothetical protein